MYKVIYQKNDGKVVGCYPFEYEPITVYIFKDIIPETGEEIEFEIPESEVVNYESSKIEKIEKQEESAKFFYNKETCEAVDCEAVPNTLSKNQYLVYQNGNFIVKIDNSSAIAELKSKLDATDYIAKKVAEATAKALIGGDTSKLAALLTEYSAELSQREAWRDEINSLEAMQ